MVSLPIFISIFPMTGKTSAMAPPPPPPTKPDTPLLLLPPPPATSAPTTSSNSGNTSGSGGAISNHEPLHSLPLPPSRADGTTKVRTPRSSKLSKAQLLRRPRRTNAFIWLSAVLCFVFSVSIILAGAATLVVFLVIKPKYPLFDAAEGSLGSVYLDTPLYLNGDLTLRANFSNPNRKVDLLFELLSLDLFFSDQLIATQWVQPFEQRRGESRTEMVHMITSEVYLPINLSLELQKQVQSNRVVYFLHGRFRVKAKLGLLHFSYWIHARCRIELTAPPSGVLVARSCRTRR